MGCGRGHDGGGRADDVLQSGCSGNFHAGGDLVIRADIARRGQAARVYRHLRYVRRAAAGLRGMDGGECRKCRAAYHNDAALLPRASWSGDQMEHLRRAPREVAWPPGAASRRPEMTRIGHVPSSLNLLAHNSVMAERAASASGPMAETIMDVPGPAE